MRRLLAALAALSLLGAACPASAETVQRAVDAGRLGDRPQVRRGGALHRPAALAQRRHQPGPAARRHPAHQCRRASRGAVCRQHADPVARNSTLLVKQIGAAADTVLGARGRRDLGACRARRRRADRRDAGRRGRRPRHRLVDDGRRRGKTSLIVLEGLVELANELGSVSVAGGEGAVASIGQAPTKVVIVDPDDREQMLFYLSLRECLRLDAGLAASSADMRRQRSRIAAIPASARSAEDWLTLAEVSLSYDGKQAAARRRANRRASSACRRRRRHGSTSSTRSSPGAEQPLRRGGAAFQTGSAAARRQTSRHRALRRLFRARACRSGPRGGAARRLRGRTLRGARRSLDRRIPEGHSGCDRRHQAGRGALSGRSDLAGLPRAARASHGRPRAGEGGDRPVAGHRSGRPDRARSARQLQGRVRRAIWKAPMPT